MTDWLLVGLGVLLTFGTAIFVAAEFSLVTLDPATVAKEPRAADRRGQSVLKALHKLSTQLSGAQVGITVTTVTLGYTTQPAVTRMLGESLGGTAAGPVLTGVLSVVGAVLIVNGFSMLFGELVPKNFAIARPFGTARTVVGLQRGFTTLFHPLIVMFNNTANALLRKVGVEPREELAGGRSRQELAALVRRSAEAGTLERATARLLTNSIEFEELAAIDVMTDRLRMVVLSREDSAADVLRLARETGHSRFPVIDSSRDDIVGLVHLRQAVAVPFERREEVPAAALMVDAPRVPETVRLGDLLVELRSVPMQMALVVDEYGGTSGVVTLEDVVEELVGDVRDEHDRRRTNVSRLADGAWQVPGLLRPDELTEHTGLVVPDDGPFETLGGLVMDALGRVPEQGDVVEAGGVRLRVDHMAGRRVDRLRVERLPEDDAEATGDVGRGPGRGRRGEGR